MQKKKSKVDSTHDQTIKPEDPVLAQYEFYYLYKWKRNNVAVQKFRLRRDQERIQRQKEEEEAKRLEMIR